MRIPQSTIAPPELPAAFAPRRHLIDLLDRAGAEQLVAVIAPPGYGKTVLLTHWLRRPGAPRAAWVSLDATFDVARFRAALCAALATVPDLPPDCDLGRLVRGGPRHRGPEFVDDLGAALDTHRPAVRLVLDDLHELTDPDALHDLARLVRRRPAGLRLVVASRLDPPLSVPRLRLEGRLHELRAEQLRFTLDETDTLIRATGVELTRPQVAALHGRTVGWVAGLRFAAIALRSTADRQRFIDRFSGTERSVADYLAGEVMASLPSATRDFLLGGSVCAELPVNLAVALTGRPDAGRMLDGLARGTALVQRVEPATYRIHPLLRSYLVAELARHQPATYRRAQVTAAWWWYGTGDPVHTLGHAERSGDFTLLQALLRDLGLRMIAAGAFVELRRVLDVVRAPGGHEDAWVPLLEAVVEHRLGSRRSAAAALEQAVRIWPAEPEPTLVLLRSSVELLVHDRCTTHPRLPDGTDAGSPTAAQLYELCRATAELTRSDVDRDAVRAVLVRIVSSAHDRALPYFEVWALTQLAVLELHQGRYRPMAAAARSAVSAADHAGLEHGLSASSNSLLAYRDLLAADPVAARDRAQAALARCPVPAAELSLRVVHGAALCDLGETDTGLAGSRPVLFDIGNQLPAPLLAAIAALEHRVALVHSGPASAAGTAAWLESRVGKVGEVLLMDALAHQIAGQHDAARLAVEPIVTGAVPVLVAHTPVEAHLVLAESALRAGALDRGRAELGTALALATELSVVRPLALTAGLAGELIGSAVADRAGAWLRGRLAAACSVVRSRVPAALSDRELAVLALLPSLLNAAEIAEELTVSVNTVKTHIRSIYAKLAVGNRRDAVNRAQERNLLP